jgi:predicted transcriptional regulator
VILAVCATLSTFKGGGFSTRAVLTQSHAANQWAYYQAKSIKGYLHEIEKEKLELELKVMGSKAPKSIVDDYEKKIESYTKNTKRYDEEKS